MGTERKECPEETVPSKQVLGEKWNINGADKRTPGRKGKAGQVVEKEERGDPGPQPAEHLCGALCGAASYPLTPSL